MGDVKPEPSCIRVDVSYLDEDGEQHVTRLEGEIAVVAVSSVSPGGSSPHVVFRGDATLKHISATVAGILGTLERDCDKEAVEVALDMYRNNLEHIEDL